MQKRLIIAIALSVLIIMVFQSQMRKMTPAPLLPGPATQAAAPAQVLDSGQPLATEEASGTPPQALKEKEILTTVNTDKYIVTLTNLGGSIVDLRLREFGDAKTEGPLTLVRDLTPLDAIFSMGIQNPPAILGQVIFDLVKGADKVIYTYELPNRFEIRKEFNFYNTQDYIGLHIFIKNVTDYPLGMQYRLVGPSGLETTDKLAGRSFLESNSMIDGKLVRKSRVKSGEEFLPGITAWTGMKNRYFSLVLQPKEEAEGVILKQTADKKISVDIRTKVKVIQPGSTIEDAYILYIGPTDAARIAQVSSGINAIVNYGIFTSITMLLLRILRFFQGLVHNWGVAIILLTILVNMILFPLTRKSFASMRKMQDVQPHIEKLRKLHKDNPHKLNKELAELYKANKINPFGGCLPLFLQMPVFISLYQGLIKSIELKNAHFLWIKDLSSPDAVALPFTLPVLGDHINVLPILTAVAMLLQQKISAHGTAGASEEHKKQQQVMMIFFPIFFGVLFYNFPSGLVLYWLTNTILMVVEHSALKKVL